MISPKGCRQLLLLTSDPMEADVVVTDHEVKCIEEAQIIREYDFEKIRMLMEDAK